MIAMTQLVCLCGKSYGVRTADVNRGWGKTCSKRCAAVLRERNKKRKPLPSVAIKVRPKVPKISVDTSTPPPVVYMKYPERSKAT